MQKDVIYRQEAIDGMRKLQRWNVVRGYNKNEGFLYDDVMYLLDKLPPAQSEKGKGKWIRNDNGTYSCSICQSWIPEEQYHYARYCLYCGAEMRENDNEK